MDRKTFIIIMGAMLIVSFFLDFLGAGVSGYDVVSSASGGNDWTKFLLLLIPVTGLLLLIGALSPSFSIGINLTWLPLLALIFFIFIAPLIDGVDMGAVFKSLGKGWGIGLWLAIVASVLLAFYNPRRRVRI